MKHIALVLCLLLLAPGARGQSDAQIEEAHVVRDAVEYERIRQARAGEQVKVAALEAACYQRFAVNDCLIKVRAQRREVLADLRRQEISLNDALRKRRGAEQLLRSDARAPVLP